MRAIGNSHPRRIPLRTTLEPTHRYSCTWHVERPEMSALMHLAYSATPLSAPARMPHRVCRPPMLRRRYGRGLQAAVMPATIQAAVRPRRHSARLSACLPVCVCVVCVCVGVCVCMRIPPAHSAPTPRCAPVHSPTGARTATHTVSRHHLHTHRLQLRDRACVRVRVLADCISALQCDVLFL